MKKLLLSILITTFTFAVNAQNDPIAKKLLEEVSKKYNSYKTIQSDFKLTVENSKKETFTESGSMYFNKPKKQYAILLNEQEILSNGKDIWNISKEIKEVQISKAEEDNSQIGPNNLFTFYKSGYKYTMKPDVKINSNGKSETLKVIDLSPLDTKTNYSKITLRINKNNHIHDVTIYDKSNNQYSYLIESLYIGKNLSNQYFSFDKNKYKGYEIIDLR